MCLITDQKIINSSPESLNFHFSKSRGYTSIGRFTPVVKVCTNSKTLRDFHVDSSFKTETKYSDSTLFHVETITGNLIPAHTVLRRRYLHSLHTGHNIVYTTSLVCSLQPITNTYTGTDSVYRIV